MISLYRTEVYNSRVEIRRYNPDGLLLRKQIATTFRGIFQKEGVDTKTEFVYDLPGSFIGKVVE